tara:strand:+ start:3134 stop:3982 length:849 start_codon:yes stop_codon:yes gene_type:complete
MAFEFDNMFDINNKKSQSLYNPNDITKTASAGIGSGNPVQSAQQKQQNMTQGQNMQSNPYLNNSWYGGGGDIGAGSWDWYSESLGGAYDYGYGAQNVSDPFETTATNTTQSSAFDATASQGSMSQMDLLRGYFPDIDDDTLSQYQQFITPIPGELYDATDPNFGLYTSLRKEKTGFLSDSRQRGREDLRSALFTGHREARGLEGKRGFVSGRTIVSDISEEAARKGDSLNQAFQKGLWDINQDIVGRVSSARKYYQSLVGQQRRDMLSLAELSDYFKNEDEE